MNQAFTDGEKMYRKGILPSGKPLPVAIQGDVSVPGTTFACASCHSRSGVAVMDETQRIPSVNGPFLFRTLYPIFPNLSPSEREELPARYQAPPLRPAYTDATLSRAIREGVDPKGRSFNHTMPRYVLSDPDMAILIKYLKSLSSEPSPGVTDTSIALATVVTEDVSQQDRDAMLNSLEDMVRTHNAIGNSPGDMRRMVTMQVMYLSFRSYTLARWVLKGPPKTWRAQLENFYSQNPVFALVGGISNSSWKPIHQFCGDHQIPCILPITDLPEISKADYYTLYFSKGYYQEGEAVARYLSQNTNLLGSGSLTQVLDSRPEAKALAAGFQNAWSSAGGKPIKSISITNNQPLTGEWLSKLVPTGKETALLLWTGAESYGALQSLASARNRPEFVFLSSSVLAERLWDLPSEARSFTYLSYPFREPGKKKLPARMGRPGSIVVNKDYRKNDHRIASRTATSAAVLNDALTRMERNFYSDYLLDVIDAMEVQDTSDYELLNFGPGRRYVSEGCYIMRLSEKPNATLVRISDWDGSDSTNGHFVFPIAADNAVCFDSRIALLARTGANLLGTSSTLKGLLK
jgi:hypothetical protein